MPKCPKCGFKLTESQWCLKCDAYWRAERERWLRWLGLMTWSLCIVATDVRAHKEPGETVAYPHDCCGSGDCAPIEKLVRLPNGDMLITTKHGTTVFPASFPWREFESDKAHACFIGDTKYCLLARTSM